MRYGPVLLHSSVVFGVAFGHTYLLLLLRSAPSAAIGRSCCGIPLLFSARLLAVSFISHSFVGLHVVSLRCGFWPYTYSPFLGRASDWPVLLRSCFVLGVAALAVTPTSCCFFGPCLCALLACRAAFLQCYRRGRFMGVAPCSLLARSAAFLLCPRRGLWPFFRVPYLGRRSVCYWRDVFLLSLLLLGRAFVRCRPILHVAFRRYMLPPLAAFARPCVLSSCSGGFSGYVPAAFCQALSPPCGRAAAFLATCQPPPARCYSGSSLRPGGGFLVTCHPPSCQALCPWLLGPANCLPPLPPSLFFSLGKLVCIMLELISNLSEGHGVFGAAPRMGGKSVAVPATAAGYLPFRKCPFGSFWSRLLDPVAVAAGGRYLRRSSE